MPIHSLSGTDVAALQGSQAEGNSLHAIQHVWAQHQDEASQRAHHVQHIGQGMQAGQGMQSGQGLHSGQAAMSSNPHSFQPESVPAASPSQAQNGSLSQPSLHNLGFESLKAGSSADGQAHPDTHQQYRPPKRKLPFSIGLAQGVKRHSPDLSPQQAAAAAQRPAQASDSASEMAKMSPSKFLSLHPSPLSQQRSQPMSSSLLIDLSHQTSPAARLTGQQVGAALASSPAAWSPPVSATRPAQL